MGLTSKSFAGAALAAIVALASVLVVPAASAQTQAEVAQRDQLIADQENLLNAYRCMFGVDTDAVRGQCSNPDSVSPQAAPQNPTQQDIDLRDGLIQSQEALLNDYRCRFDIDTELVPGGCGDQQPASTPAPEQPAQAGWFSDPSCRNALRWWDGDRWTDQVRSGGAGSSDPLSEGESFTSSGQQTTPEDAPSSDPLQSGESYPPPEAGADPNCASTAPAETNPVPDDHG